MKIIDANTGIEYTAGDKIPTTAKPILFEGESDILTQKGHKNMIKIIKYGFLGYGKTEKEARSSLARTLWRLHALGLSKRIGKISPQRAKLK